MRTGDTNIVKPNMKMIVNRSDPKNYLNFKPYGIRILASLKIVHNEKRRETISEITFFVAHTIFCCFLFKINIFSIISLE